MEAEEEEEENEPEEPAEPVVRGMKDAYDSINQKETPEKPFGEPHTLLEPVEQEPQEETPNESVPFNAQIKELEHVAIMFDQVRDMHKQFNPSGDSEMGTFFDDNINRVLSWLKESISDPSISSQSACGLKAKNDVLDLCFEKLIEYCDTVDPSMINSKVTDVMNQIKTTQTKIVDELFSLTCRSSTDTRAFRSRESYSKENA